MLERNEYEALRKLILPELIPSDDPFNLEIFLERLKFLFNLAEVQMKGEDFALGFGFHIHTIKRGRKVLFYDTTCGYNMPGKVEKKLKEDVNILKRAMNKKHKTIWGSDLEDPYLRLDGLEHAEDVEKEIKDILESNIYSQLLDLGDYPRFIREKKSIYDERYRISYSQDELRRAGEIWTSEYFIITTLESVFFAPQYIEDSDFQQFNTVMLSEPVYLAYTIPIGDIFIVFTYNRDKIKDNILNSFLSNIFKNENLIRTVKDELRSLCRISYMYQIIRRHALRSAIAAIMARNMSHNIGSHVLASSDLVNVANNQEIQTLHSYIQQRMDFISQVVTYVPSWGEPLYFFQDLLRGFLTQHLLLGHLVKDQRYDEEKISFYIHHSVETSHFPLVGENEKSWWDASKVSEDFLIAIPGGTIGSHAFYDILENTMRNSAKYGCSKQQSNMDVHIQLDERENFYIVTIWDNLSPAEKNENGTKIDLVRSMNGKLKERLIDEGGQIVAESRGIHEMKECARILTVPYEEELHYQERDKQGQPLHIKAMPQEQDGQKYLAYQFYLQKPRLIGIWGRKVQHDMAKKLGIFSFENLEKLKRNPHQFTLFFTDNDHSLTDLLEFIGKNHHLLPYRLLVITNNQNMDLNRFGVPRQRVYFCNLGEVQLPDDNEQKEWEDFIIQIYELWLKKFKSLPKEEKWQLVVSFERDERDSVFDRWQKLLQHHKSQVVDVHLYRCWNSRYKWISCSGGTEQDEAYIPTGSLLAYDNHDRLRSAFEQHKRNINFYSYHSSGQENIKMFQTIESPPCLRFEFHYFILGLLEALLTNIVVVDERVAEAILQPENGSFVDLPLMLKLIPMRYYPIFSIWKDSKREYISDFVGENNIVQATKKEGLYLSKPVYNFANKNGIVESRNEADLIVVHQGVVDRLKNLGIWEEGSAYPQLDALYQIAPVVVITSGRGRTLRHVPNTVPFIEFSIIRENTYPSQSKYHLIRVLLSICGVEELSS